MSGLRVELNGVTARHPAATAQSNPAIDALTLSIEPGEHVAVIGPSGAGKTTLLQLLGAALKPSQGVVILDQQPVWTLSTRQLQRQRGRLFYAPQSPPLPPRQRVVVSLLAAKLPTLSLWRSLQNLLYPQHVDEVVKALAQFDLQEKIWERVDRLSGGERQRILIARGLLKKDAKIFLFDEATSSLDAYTEKQITGELDKLMKGKTVIYCAHRLSSIINVD
jgi:phosphonate transport system ATP-binding protein